MNNQDQPLIFELSTPDRIGFSLPEMDVAEMALDELIPSDYIRAEEAELPEVHEEHFSLSKYIRLFFKIFWH